MNVSLLSEWRCLFRNKKVISTSLRGPKFCWKKFTWIYLDFEFVVCFCKKFFAESKNGVVLKIFFRCHGNQFKATKFSRLKRKREHSVPRSQVPKNPVVHSKCTNYFLGLDTQLRGVTTLAKSPVVLSFDGSWSKWGYTANHCVGFVISAATGKVLDLEIISKTCGMCLQKKSSLIEDQFEQWYQTYHCEGSYKGPSPSMEMECAKRMSGRSEQDFIRYTWMISDGDSKAYNAIWSIYGACDTCHHYENLQNSDQEYVTWKASEGFEKWEEDHLAGTAGCDRVMKLDCIGHVQKRLWKALYEFKKSSVKLKDLKPIYGRNGRLKRLQSRNWKRIMARQFITM